MVLFQKAAVTSVFSFVSVTILNQSIHFKYTKQFVLIIIIGLVVVLICNLKWSRQEIKKTQVRTTNLYQHLHTLISNVCYYNTYKKYTLLYYYLCNTDTHILITQI